MCIRDRHYNPNKPTEAPCVWCLEKIDAIQRDVAEKVAYLVCLKAVSYTHLEVPWKHPSKYWRDADDAQLISYVDSHYGTFSQRNYQIAVTKVADDRSYV